MFTFVDIKKPLESVEGFSKRLDKNKDSMNNKLESLRQIYIKTDGNSHKSIKSTNDKININYKTVTALAKSVKPASSKIIFYCILYMRTQENEFDTMSIKLDFTNTACRSFIAKDKGLFYGAIRELLEAGFLLKWEPTIYLVHHNFLSCLTSAQSSKLKRESYFNIQSHQDDNFLNLKPV